MIIVSTESAVMRVLTARFVATLTEVEERADLGHAVRMHQMLVFPSYVAERNRVSQRARPVLHCVSNLCFVRLLLLHDFSKYVVNVGHLFFRLFLTKIAVFTR